MLAVYLAGPISTGNQFDNVHRAVVDAARLRAAGFAVMVPHRCALDELVLGAQSYEAWLDEDKEWIRRCDAVVRRPGESKGSDIEVAFAREIGRPVYFGVDEFLRAIEGEGPMLVEATRPAADVAELLGRSRKRLAGAR